MSLILIMTLFADLATGQQPIRGVGSDGQIPKMAPRLSDIITKSRPAMSPELSRFLDQKVKELKNPFAPALVPIDFKNNKEFKLLLSPTVSVRFEVLDPKVGKFKLNSTPIQYSPNIEPQKLWDQVIKALPSSFSRSPQKQTFSFSSFIMIDEAYALLPILILVGAAAVVIIGAMSMGSSASSHLKDKLDKRHFQDAWVACQAIKDSGYVQGPTPEQVELFSRIQKLCLKVPLPPELNDWSLGGFLCDCLKKLESRVGPFETDSASGATSAQ